MVDIDDLDGVGEVDVAQIPDLGRSVTEHHLALGAVQAALLGFAIDALPKGRRVLDGRRIGGRVGIASRAAALVELGLREDAAKLHLASGGRRARRPRRG